MFVQAKARRFKSGFFLVTAQQSVPVNIKSIQIGHLRISIGWLGDEEARDERFELSDEVNQVRSSLSSAPRPLLQI